MVTFYCEECGCKLAAWESVYSWESNGKTEYVCEDCFDSLFLALTRSERAAILHLAVMTAADRLAP